MSFIFYSVLISFGLLAHESHQHQELGVPGPGLHQGLTEELPDDPVGQQAFKLFSRRNIDKTQMQLERGEVVLTIDDGPTPRVTEAVLDVLADFKIRAVFFVVGSRAKRFPEIMQRIAREGHVIANHTYRHALDFPTVTDMYREIGRAHDTMEPYLGLSNTRRYYFRAPGGVWNSWRANNLRSSEQLRRKPVLGEYIGPIFWNVGGALQGSRHNPRGAADWACWSKGWTTEQCARGYYAELMRKGRGVILMHDLRSKTPQMLRILLSLMTREGIQNREGEGYWNFLDIDEIQALDRFVHDAP